MRSTLVALDRTEQTRTCPRSVGDRPVDLGGAARSREVDVDADDRAGDGLPDHVGPLGGREAAGVEDEGHVRPPWPAARAAWWLVEASYRYGTPPGPPQAVVV
jgi:hypothetical protein